MEEGPSTEGDKKKHLSNGVEDIITDGVATHIESGGMDILARHSKVVEQDDKMNKGKAGIMPNQEIQLEKGLNLLDKQEEIHIVSNNNIDIYLSFYFFFSCFNPIFSYHSLKISIAYADIRTRLEAYRQFVDLDDAQIVLLVEAITTYPHLWNACEKFSEHFQAWRLIMNEMKSLK